MLRVAFFLFALSGNVFAEGTSLRNLDPKIPEQKEVIENLKLSVGSELYLEQHLNKNDLQDTALLTYMCFKEKKFGCRLVRLEAGKKSAKK